MAHNERQMLPRWVRHYSGQLGGAEHLHVIDHASTDGSTSALPCSVHAGRARPIGQGFERDRLELVNRLADSLLARYDAVLFTDADEMLVADPARFASLVDLYEDRGTVEALAGIGVNVLHTRSDPPLRADLP